MQTSDANAYVEACLDGWRYTELLSWVRVRIAAATPPQTRAESIALAGLESASAQCHLANWDLAVAYTACDRSLAILRLVRAGMLPTHDLTLPLATALTAYAETAAADGDDSVASTLAAQVTATLDQPPPADSRPLAEHLNPLKARVLLLEHTARLNAAAPATWLKRAEVAVNVPLPERLRIDLLVRIAAIHEKLGSRPDAIMTLRQALRSSMTEAPALRLLRAEALTDLATVMEAGGCLHGLALRLHRRALWLTASLLPRHARNRDVWRVRGLSLGSLSWSVRYYGVMDETMKYSARALEAAQFVRANFPQHASRKKLINRLHAHALALPREHAWMGVRFEEHATALAAELHSTPGSPEALTSDADCEGRLASAISKAHGAESAVRHYYRATQHAVATMRMQPSHARSLRDAAESKAFLANAEFLLGDYGAARREIEASLQDFALAHTLAPARFDSLLKESNGRGLYADLLRRAGDTAGARSQLQRAMSLSVHAELFEKRPNLILHYRAKYHETLAKTWSQDGQAMKARKHLQTALGLRRQWEAVSRSREAASELANVHYELMEVGCTLEDWPASLVHLEAAIRATRMLGLRDPNSDWQKQEAKMLKLLPEMQVKAANARAEALHLNSAR